MIKNCLILLIIISVSCAGQNKLPILKANSELLSIREGNVIYPDIWRISPEVKLDEYVAKKFSNSKTISFYSKIDTISFNVVPNKNYDFIVSINNKKAFTRISTDTIKAKMPDMKILNFDYIKKNLIENNDTIPFSIGKDNRIYIKGKINNSDSLNIIFDTGANGFAITSHLVDEKVKMKMDGETLNSGSDGTSIKKTSSKNILKVGNLIWNDVVFTSIDYKGYDFDAVMGWIAFGGKIVEINYEKNIIVVHKDLENIPSVYSKIETVMIGGIPYIKGIITVDNKEYPGWFEYDTGGRRSFYLSQKFTQKNNLNYRNMQLIGTSESSGSKGVNFERNTYRLPKFKFGEFETYQIPISIAKIDPENVDFNDILGNDLLKRFNAIIDFKNYQIYLKPNNLLHSEYQE